MILTTKEDLLMASGKIIRATVKHRSIAIAVIRGGHPEPIGTLRVGKHTMEVKEVTLYRRPHDAETTTENVMWLVVKATDRGFSVGYAIALVALGELILEVNDA